MTKEEALALQIPMKPKMKFISPMGAYFVHVCGNCGTEVMSGTKYCRECGQKQDWSVDKGEV